MSLDQLIPILILIIAGYLCVYGIVNRICTCVETCSALKLAMRQEKHILKKLNSELKQ